MISTVINNTVPRNEKQKITYRSFKNFNIDSYNEELCILNVENYSIDPDNLDSVYNTFENDVVEIMNKHAPFKQAYRKPVQLPYMNKELRKVIYTKQMSFNEYNKTKISRFWEQYRNNRN